MSSLSPSFHGQIPDKDDCPMIAASLSSWAVRSDGTCPPPFSYFFLFCDSFLDIYFDVSSPFFSFFYLSLGPNLRGHSIHSLGDWWPSLHCDIVTPEDTLPRSVFFNLHLGHITSISVVVKLFWIFNFCCHLLKLPSLATSLDLTAFFMVHQTDVLI